MLRFFKEKSLENSRDFSLNFLNLILFHFNNIIFKIHICKSLAKIDH